MSDITLSGWLDSTAEIRAKLLAYSRSPIPTDPGARQLDVSEALTLGQDAGDLMVDVDKHLADRTAQEILGFKGEGFSADERKQLIKSKVSDITMLRNKLKIIYKTITDRRFSLMSVGRW